MIQTSNTYIHVSREIYRSRKFTTTKLPLGGSKIKDYQEISEMFYGKKEEC